MNIKQHIHLLLIITILFGYTSIINAKTLDHEVFVEQIKNSSDNIYNQCLKEYDEYLAEFPNDILVQIEKCKFIEYAQYDEYDEYNPNQAAFDSCAAILVAKYPKNPDVLIFHTTYIWGEELMEVLAKIEKLVKQNPYVWDEVSLGELFLSIASNYYYNDEYELAYEYIRKAIALDETHNVSIVYARILIENSKNDEAQKVLLSGNDSTTDTWQLSQKAALLLLIESFDEALELYTLIDNIDSTYNSNSKLAKTLEGLEKYAEARTYFIADTSSNWNKELAAQNLFIHDLKHQADSLCIQSYNAYRDFGYNTDSIALYRLKLFFAHPLQGWKFRDFIGIIALLLLFALMLILPSIWILPVYFIGHKWKFVERNKNIKTIWGLKAFWFVSVGYLFASIISEFTDPTYLYSLFSDSAYAAEISEQSMGLMTLVFIIVFGSTGFATLYKKNLRVLLSSLLPINKSILVGIGILLAYKLISAIYIRLGMHIFDVSIADMANIPNYFLASREDITSLLSTYGKFISFLLICIIVPIYEEVVFRGVILDSVKRYINFNTANILQAALFATIHMNLFLFPVFFFFGIITGILRKKSGGLLSGIVFHIFNNIIALTPLLMK